MESYLKKNSRKKRVLSEKNYNSDSDFDSDNSHIKFVPEKVKPKEKVKKTKKLN